MTLNYGELRKGMAIEIDGEAYIIVDYKHNKMQQRAPTMRIRMRALSNGRLTEKSFSGFDVTFTPADVNRRKTRFIYEEDGLHYFMDNETFEQFPLDESQLGDNNRAFNNYGSNHRGRSIRGWFVEYWWLWVYCAIRLNFRCFHYLGLDASSKPGFWCYHFIRRA